MQLIVTMYIFSLEILAFLRNYKFLNTNLIRCNENVVYINTQRVQKNTPMRLSA